MKIYIVSCSPPRVERLMKAAAPLNLDFEVVESPLGTDEEVQRRGKTCLERGTGYATGIAATIGHIRAMERIASRDDPLAIIIEDDVRFHNKFNEYLEMCVNYMKNNTCDILSIGFVNFPRLEKTVHIGDLIGCENVPLGSPWGAQGYIITKKYASYFYKLTDVEDYSVIYNGNFVTDSVMFDPILNCKRSTLSHPIIVEDPTEQTLAGNNNKPDLFRSIDRDLFYMS
jgi:GR25 family glycosyltransferase involved in LPS biosynthesis